jgi:hypothetical protein
MEISAKLVPGQGHVATQGVAIREESLPEWVVVLWFVVELSAFSGRPEGWYCTGFELRPGDPDRPAPRGSRFALASPPQLGADALRHVERNFVRYVAVARSVLEWDAEDAAARLGRLRRRGRVGMTDEFYGHVAEQYRALVARGERPTTGLARAQGVGRSTASRWVREARKRGFLGPAMPRRAGEHDREED